MTDTIIFTRNNSRSSESSLSTGKVRRCARHFARGIAVTAAVIGVTAMAVPSASAGSTPFTDSEDIGVEAVVAVEAFDQWNLTGETTDYEQFEQARDKVATMTAVDLGLSPVDIRNQFSETTMVKQRIVLAAMTQLGVPYRSMQSRVGEGFDCSGLTLWAFGEAGLEIPRSSGDQFRAADRRESDVAEAGDLVYYPGHIGIYLGGDIYMHSRQTGRNVEVTMLPSRSHSFADIVPPEVDRAAGTIGDVPGAPVVARPASSAAVAPR